mmetsp:Transcript_65777/g.176234  ORF Transcript_65777/g.176234 Transcript_65777/m.176234 type:complete len:430 (-) Transcript_65777:54-1343(-)
MGNDCHHAQRPYVHRRAESRRCQRRDGPAVGLAQLPRPVLLLGHVGRLPDERPGHRQEPADAQDPALPLQLRRRRDARHRGKPPTSPGEPRHAPLPPRSPAPSTRNAFVHAATRARARTRARGTHTHTLIFVVPRPLRRPIPGEFIKGLARARARTHTHTQQSQHHQQQQQHTRPRALRTAQVNPIMLRCHVVAVESDLDGEGGLPFLNRVKLRLDEPLSAQCIRQDAPPAQEVPKLVLGGQILYPTDYVKKEMTFHVIMREPPGVGDSLVFECAGDLDFFLNGDWVGRIRGVPNRAVPAACMSERGDMVRLTVPFSTRDQRDLDRIRSAIVGVGTALGRDDLADFAGDYGLLSDWVILKALRRCNNDAGVAAQLARAFCERAIEQGMNRSRRKLIDYDEYGADEVEDEPTSPSRTSPMQRGREFYEML